jgi:prophage tail gpP-like protein
MSTVEAMTTQFVELQDRKRANLARIAKHDAYLVREEPDGTLVWEPATVITEAERKLLQDAALMASIEHTRQNPTSLRRRDRSGAPRGD